VEVEVEVKLKARVSVRVSVGVRVRIMARVELRMNGLLSAKRTSTCRCREKWKGEQGRGKDEKGEDGETAEVKGPVIRSQYIYIYRERERSEVREGEEDVKRPGSVASTECSIGGRRPREIPLSSPGGLSSSPLSAPARSTLSPRSVSGGGSGGCMM